MHGEAKVPDAPIGKRRGCPGKQIVLQNRIAPAALVQRMKEIEVNVVGLELFQLLVEVFVEVLRTGDGPKRQLGASLTFSR